MNAPEGSLRRLCTDHVGLYQVDLYDATTPMEETMRTLEDMVRSGKVRSIGASQYQAWQICHCNDITERYGWARVSTIQAEYNLIQRRAEDDLLPFCRDQGVGLLPFFALANGLLSGGYVQGAPPPSDSRVAALDDIQRYVSVHGTPQNYAIIDSLTNYAVDYGHTLADPAIAWLLAEPAVASIVTGASSPQQIASNARAASWTLSAEQAADVRAIAEDRAEL